MKQLPVDYIIAETRAWVSRAVIGLNLCPFARAVQARDQIRYVVSEARDRHSLRDELRRQLRFLAASDPATTQQAETTLLIHPNVLTNFLEYNEFLNEVEAEIEAMGLTGTLQVASFHPKYRFEGTSNDDITNVTNRSPYPMLHLLRESSVEQAVKAYPETSSIYEANKRTVRALGRKKWNDLLDLCRQDAENQNGPADA